MADRFIAAQCLNSFPSEADVRKEIQDIAASRDSQRPVEKRFEQELLKRATPVRLLGGGELIAVGEMLFIVAPNQPKGGFDLFGSGQGMSFSSLDEAKEWTAEFAQISPGAWKIFEREQ